MDYAVSRARLKNYFSTVTYIDDRFDHCIIDEPLDFGDEETVDTPPLPILGLATPPIATGEIAPIPHADEKDMEINLSTILAALNDEKYAGIRFTPVLFKDNLAKEILVKKIQESPLTLFEGWSRRVIHEVCSKLKGPFQVKINGQALHLPVYFI